MKHVALYLRKYRAEAVLAPLLKCAEATLELLVPLIMRRIIDEAIPAGDFAAVKSNGLLLVGLAVCGLLCSVVAQFCAAHSSYRMGTDMRNGLLSHINSLSMTEMDGIGTSKLINHLNTDVVRVQDGVNLFLRLFLRSPFIVVGSLVLAYLVEPKLAVVMLCALPVLAAAVFLIARFGLNRVTAAQNKLDHLAQKSRENLSGARVIRAFGRTDAEEAEFSEAGEGLKALQLEAGRVTELMNPLTYILLNLAIALILYRGGRFVQIGTVTTGTVIAIIDYMTELLTETIRVSELVASLSKGIASARRVEKIFGTENSMEDGTLTEVAPAEETIRFENVSLRYHAEADEALSGLSFTVRAGERVGIIGGTGEGKTSLLGLIPRLYDATEGTVYVDGADVRAYRLEALRGKMGIAPQRAVLMEGSVRENIRMGRAEVSDADIERALRTAQAYDFVTEKPEGLDYLVRKKGDNFSGGQKQRLAIARALAASPEILLLDDSFSALDALTDRRLREALSENYPGTTLLFVSQRVTTVMSADRILVLDDGKLAGCGTHKELVRTCPVYCEICASQEILPEDAGTSGEEVSAHE